MSIKFSSVLIIPDFRLNSISITPLSVTVKSDESKNILPPEILYILYPAGTAENLKIKFRGTVAQSIYTLCVPSSFLIKSDSSDSYSISKSSPTSVVVLYTSEKVVGFTVRSYPPTISCM